MVKDRSARGNFNVFPVLSEIRIVRQNPSAGFWFDQISRRDARELAEKLLAALKQPAIRLRPRRARRK